MIEKKTMGYAEFDYPANEAKAVTVVMNSETGEVELYRPQEDENEWFTPSDGDHFYPTVDEAAAALDKHRHELIAKMEDVKAYVEVMNNWRYYVKKGDPFYFTDGDYLPYQNTREARDDAYYKREAKRSEKENDIMRGIFRKGFVNVRGNSFRLDDVQALKWGEKCVEIVLTNGKLVQTSTEAEFNVITYLFGSNTSDYTYTHLNKEEE